MAGTPKRKTDLARLETEEGLGELVLTRLEEGKQFARICEETKLCKAAILDWLEHPDRQGKFAQARERASHVYAAEQLEIADDIPDEASAGQIHKAKLRITTRQWIAERWNRTAYGQKPAELTLNLNVMHLDALRQRSTQLVEDVTPKPLMIENKQEQE